MKHTIAGAFALLATGLAAWAAPPRDLSYSGVQAWAKTAGLKLDKLVFVGAEPEGAFFSEQMVRFTRFPDENLARTVVVQAHFERFEPARDTKGREIRSERAQLRIKCGNPVMVKLDGEPKGYSGYGGGGRYVGPGDSRVWAQLAPNGQREATVTEGTLAAQQALKSCQAQHIPQVQPPR